MEEGKEVKKQGNKEVVRNDSNVRSVRGVRDIKDNEENKENQNQELENKEVLDVRNDSSVRSVRNTNLTNLTKITPNISIQTLKEILGSGNLEFILSYLYKSKPKSYQQISKEINKKSAVINTTIKRNQKYFQEDSKQGQIKFFKLSLLGENFIKEKINQHEIAQEFLKKREVEREKKQKGTEELVIEGKGFFNTYKKQIGEEIRKGSKSVCVDFKDLSSYSPILSESLLDNPIEILEILEVALDETELIKNAKIRLKNLPETCNYSIENLREKYLNKLVVVEARVVSLSSVRILTTSIKFECPSCGTVISILQTESTTKEPRRCSCGRAGNFKLLSRERSDISKIFLEDLQEKTDNPQTQRLTALIRDDLTSPKNVKIFTPGNEIKCVGILKEIFKRVQMGTSIISDYVFEILNAELSKPEIEVSKFSKELIKKIKETAEKINKEEGLLEITSSFAPVVIGQNKTKEALICQICCPINNPSKETRNKLNILLIGDPATAKSVLGKFTIEVNTGSRSCSGGGSSAVGITAAVRKDEEAMGGFRVEPGVLILAKDLLFIDELNNLSEEDRPKLQEGMSEQMIRINKASIHITYKVTAGIIATSNPKFGSFDREKPLLPQFNITSPILSRFDLIFVFEDNFNENTDNLVAQRMLEREKEKIEVKYSKEFLKKFFAYVKSLKEPIIPEDLNRKIIKVYTEFRKRNKIEKSSLVDARSFLALIKLIKSLARCRLSECVQEKDLERALDILGQSYLKTPKYDELNLEEPEIQVEK